MVVAQRETQNQKNISFFVLLNDSTLFVFPLIWIRVLKYNALNVGVGYRKFNKNARKKKKTKIIPNELKVNK